MHTCRHLSIVLAGLVVLAAAALHATPAEDLARAAAIRDTLAAIDTELADNGGDWAKWGERLTPFRDDVRAVQAGTRPVKNAARITSQELEMLHLDTIETMPTDQRVYDVVIDFSRQLRARGVDLIFVPLPDKSAVYADYLSDNVPADGIVAIHVKYVMRKLLENDVEVVDLYPVFRDFRRADKDTNRLYYFGEDVHWRNQAAQLAGEAIARRLARYDAVKAALAAGSPYEPLPVARGGRNPDAVRGVLDRRIKDSYRDVGDSPFVLTGDSYSEYNCSEGTPDKPQGHLAAQVALNIGMPLTYTRDQGFWGVVPTLLAQADREVGFLKGRRVVIWTCIARSFKHSKWLKAELPPADAKPKPPEAAIPAAGVVARGTVGRTGCPPTIGTAPADYIREFMLSGLVDDKGAKLGTGEGIVHVQTIRDGKPVPGADLAGGATVTLRLLPWMAVEAKYGHIKTGNIYNVVRELGKPHYWGESIAP